MKRIRRWIHWALVCLLLVSAMTLQAFATGSDTVSMTEEIKTLDTFVPGSNVDKYGTATLGAMPCVGNAKVLVFYTTFGSAEVPGYQASAARMEELFFGYKNSLRSYYQTSSFEKLDITGTVYEYTTLHEGDYYGGLQQVVDEIIDQYRYSINWSDYDANGDGYIDGIYVIPRTDIWWKNGQGNFMITYNAEVGGLKTGAISTAINQEVDVIAHETCHMMGIGDIYADTGVNPDGLMSDCLMEDGAAGGHSIGDLPAVVKYVFGWMDNTQFISGSGSFEVTLNPASSKGSMAVVFPNGDPNSPYWFVVEYVVKEGNNKYHHYMPYSGVRVWRTEMNLDAYHNINGSATTVGSIAQMPYVYVEAVHPENVRNYYLQAGDSLTPYTSPSTGYGKSYKVEGGHKYIDELAFSGISIHVNSTRSFEARLTIQIDNSAASVPTGTAVFTPGDSSSDFINDNNKLHIGTLRSDHELNALEGLCLEDPVTGEKVPLTAQRSADMKGLQIFASKEYFPQLQENKAYTLDLASYVKTGWGGNLVIENFDGTFTFRYVPSSMEDNGWQTYEVPASWWDFESYRYLKADNDHVLVFSYLDNCLTRYVIDTTIRERVSERELEIRYPDRTALHFERVIPMEGNRYLAIFNVIKPEVNPYDAIYNGYYALYDQEGNLLDELIPENNIRYLGLHDSPVFRDDIRNVHFEFAVEGNKLQMRTLPGLAGAINTNTTYKGSDKVYKIKEGFYASVNYSDRQALVQIMNGQTGQLLYAQTSYVGSWGGKVDVASHGGKLYILTVSDSMELTTLGSDFSLIKQEMILQKHYVRYLGEACLDFTESGYWVEIAGYSDIDVDFVSTTYIFTFDWEGTLKNYYHYGDEDIRVSHPVAYSAAVVYLHDGGFYLGTTYNGHLYVHNDGITSGHTHRLTSTQMPGDGFWQSYMLHQCACGYSRMDQFKDASGHAWAGATCTTPRTCTICGLTDGLALGHSWDDPSCTASKTCAVCGSTQGATDHIYSHQYDYNCDVCGKERMVNMTRPMMNMYRMYNPNTGEHFYTGSEEERDNLVSVGWQYEGIGFTFPLTTGEPVYRLFEPVTGEHLYTMDPAEKAMLMAAGWNYEGIAFNSAFENEVPQYRLYNPNATVGAYHFTASTVERDNLLAAGWIYQGIGWYSMGA